MCNYYSNIRVIMIIGCRALAAQLRQREMIRPRASRQGSLSLARRKENNATSNYIIYECGCRRTPGLNDLGARSRTFRSGSDQVEIRVGMPSAIQREWKKVMAAKNEQTLLAPTAGTFTGGKSTHKNIQSDDIIMVFGFIKIFLN